MKKTQEKNRFTLRFTDTKVMSLFNELFATKAFESKNVLANKIIAFSIEHFAELYLSGYKSKQTAAVTPAQNDNKTMKQVKATLEDAYVMLMIIERMIATLHNTKLLELEGEKVSAEEFANGMLADLPEAYQDMKDQIIKSRAKRMSENNKGGRE